MKTKPPKIFVPDFHPKDHVYMGGDGAILPSVTSIIKDSLRIYQYKSASPAASRGTAVHMACQFYDEKDLNEATVTSEVRPYLENYKKALVHYGIKVEANELMRYEPELGYAGCVDKIAKVNGKRTVIDIKTGKTHDEWHVLQTAAYAGMLKKELGNLERGVLYLRPDSFLYVPHTNPLDFTYFRLLLAEIRIPSKDTYTDEEKQILEASNALKTKMGYTANIRPI